MIDVQRDVKFDQDKAMLCSLSRELWIPPEEELLATKEDPQDVIEKP